jgi:hypothetical protein
VPGGYVADATGSAGTGTPVRAVLPAAADNAPVVQVRVITTDAAGRDEWIGVDDIEVTAATITIPGCGTPGPTPPGPTPLGPNTPGPNAPGPIPPASRPKRPTPAPPARPELTALTLTPGAFTAARRGPALTPRGRAGAALRFRLSQPATVRFSVTPGGPRLRFQAHGGRGLNRMRFTGRIRGRRLTSGEYTFTAVARTRNGLDSAPASVRFRIESPQQ